MNPHPQAALIIVGHGSTVNPDSSAPTHQHAQAIRKQRVFREVACCFWKEEPSMTEVFAAVESELIYVVPNFISEGYFCQQVLPRELRLDGPVTERDGRIICYCDPVGVHPNMTRLLLQRAQEVAPNVPRSDTSLVIVGHGTNLNENSTRPIQNQVQIIRQGGYGFAEVIDAYMEEAPFIADWPRLTSAPNVVVVPFFIADGLHSYQDIPVLLGMAKDPGKALSENDVFRNNPISLNNRNVFYSGAIGTEPLLAEVILDQVDDFDRKHGIATASGPVGAPTRLQTALKGWRAKGRTVIGQVRIVPRKGPGFSLCHVDDTLLLDSGTLVVSREPSDALEIAARADDGTFRPLKTAPNLKHGWQLDLGSVQDLHLALDFLYPAAIGKLEAWQSGDLRAVNLRDLLGRQTGMFQCTSRITDEQADALIESCCDTETRCLRRIAWQIDPARPLRGGAAEKATEAAGAVPALANESMTLICMEACPILVGAARKTVRDAEKAAVAQSAAVEVAAE